MLLQSIVDDLMMALPEQALMEPRIGASRQAQG
jgi:hypothetical protein